MSISSAKWIWNKNDINPINKWIVFRKEIMINGKVKSAAIKISADSRYDAYLNGQFLGNGPSRAFQSEYFYDNYDITFDLLEGKNLLAFAVNHYGIQTHHLQLGQPGFICSLQIEYINGVKENMESDKSFKVAEHTGFLPDSIKVSCGRMHIEMFDANNWDENILTVDYDDSSWENAKERYSYNESFWGKLSKKNSPSYTYEPVYPQRILENNQVLANGVSVVFDFHHLFLSKKDMAMNRFAPPEWFYFSTEIISNKNMEVDLIFPYSRLWCVYGKFYLNGKDYLEHMDRFILDPRQEGPITVKINLKQGKNYLVMNCSRDSMGRLIPMYFKTGGEKLSFCSPINDEKGALCIASSLNVSNIDKIAKIESEIFEILKRREFDKVKEFCIEVDNRFVSQNHPQIPIMYSEKIKSLSNDSVSSMISANREYSIIEPDGYEREILIDFGRQSVGYLSFELVAPKGTIIDTNGIEYIDIEGKRQHADGVCTGFRYICKEGRQSYTSASWQGLRYLILKIKNFTTPIYFKEIKLLKGLHPLEQIGVFQCSDYRFNKIWEISETTIRICSKDMLIADTCHEQSFWTGDFRNAALFAYYLYNNYSNIEHSIQVSLGSLKTEKIMEASLPSVPQGPIPTWALLFVLTNKELFVFSGNEDYFAKQYQKFKQLLDNLLEYCNKDTGMFAPPFNDMIDWAGVDLRSNSYNTIANSILYKNLVDISWCANYLHDDESFVKYSKLAEQLKFNINKYLWDDNRKAYVDCMTLNCEKSNNFSIQSNSVMLMCNCADKFQNDIITNYIKCGFPDDFITIGSPFASFFYHEALINNNLMQEVIDDVIVNWSKMIDVGATSCFETFPGWERDVITRSYSHAWSASPCYVAGNIILGVSPILPGYKKARIKPFLGNLDWAFGSVPVPGSRIDVDVRKKDNGQLKVIAVVPDWIELVLDDDIEYKIIRI